MTLLSFARRFAARAVVLVAVLGGSGTALAVDETPAPKAVAVPAMPAGPSCPTCGGGPAVAGHGHGVCGRLGCGVALFHKKKAPYVVELCPGACFGYFQTQWHKWEDVCPLPYQGVGLSDAPRPAPGYIPPAGQPGTLPGVKPEGKGSDAPLPRPGGQNLPPTNPDKPN
jgi:hypothetical protein